MARDRAAANRSPAKGGTGVEIMPGKFGFLGRQVNPVGIDDYGGLDRHLNAVQPGVNPRVFQVFG